MNADNLSILDGSGDNYCTYGLAWRGGPGQPTATVKTRCPCFLRVCSRRTISARCFRSGWGFTKSFLCYQEDVDLGFRLNLYGYEAIQLADARVRHVGSACSGGRTSRLAMYHGIRNGVFVSVRCVSFPLICLALPLLVLSQLWLGVRVGESSLRLEAICDGLAFLPDLFRQRRTIQKLRRVSVWEIARLIVWIPRTLNRLAVVPLPRRKSISFEK